ncbi:AAA family ATPase [Ectobacillus sp. JY-23]|uniref:ATP-binding protein n=1 Tax=Ectobacillus sp. JY-23 TaxID=2933872 RepID=UPI001FF423DD|nr:AAA family ATPase [Ectobacillus sp. JY-23]UOY92049.1 AAA family ATPase [Ectobacillus sp. JY-23]
MRLEILHIYGYGSIEKMELSLKDITVLYGENEAGKSTIRSFIKSILFGFPIRGQYRYEPKSGAAYGGAITMMTEEYGRIRVERLPKQAVGEVIVYFSDGMQGGEEVLQQLLKGIDIGLFESVFSFDMHGLQNIRRVSREDLGNYLFSAGAVGTDILVRMEKELSSEIEALFKPNGRKPIINAGLQELAKLGDSVKKWHAKLDAYEEWQRKKRECEEHVAALRMEQEQLRLHMQDCETMRTLQPLLLQRQKDEDFLHTFSAVSFPINGIARYEALMAEWKPIRARMETLEQKIQDETRMLNELRVSANLLKREALVDECRLGHMSYESEKQELELMNRSIVQMKEDLFTLQESTGVLHDVQEIDTSLAAKEAMRQLVQTAQRLSEQKHQLDERFTEVKAQLEEQEERVRHIKGNREGRAHNQKKNISFANIKMLAVGLAISIFLFAAGLLIGIKGLSIFSLVLFAGIIVFWMMNRTPHNDAVKQLEEVEVFKLQQAEKAYERILQQYEEWEQASYGLQQETERMRKAYALPHSLPHAQLLLAFEKLEKMKRLQREIILKTKQCEDILKRTKQFEQKVLVLKQEFKISSSSVSGILHSIYALMQDEKEKQVKKQRGMELLAEKQAEYEELQHAHAAYVKERDELWQEAAVSSEESFYQRGKEYEAAESMKKQLSFADTQIKILQERLHYVDITNRTVWIDNYEALYQTYIKEMQRIQQAERQLQEQIVQYQAEITGLEEGGAYPELLHEWEVRKENLREQMKKWAAYNIAKAILEKTKARYHDEQLPRTLEAAEQYFLHLTNGRYQRVFAPTDESVFIVERTDGMRFAAHELSQATAEQLYLSLRLALADTLDRKLPLVIDDSFVHFDQERTERAISLLHHIAQKRQVIFFTCHTHLLSLFDTAETIQLKGAEFV